jgi:hypothetical protein
MAQMGSAITPKRMRDLAGAWAVLAEEARTALVALVFNHPLKIKGPTLQIQFPVTNKGNPATFSHRDYPLDDLICGFAALPYR